MFGKKFYPIKGRYDNSEVSLSSGLSISYHDVGPKSTESRTILLLHGLNAHSGTWRKNVPFFANVGWRPIAPTLPRVEILPTAEEIEEYSEMIHELVKKLSIAEFDVIGNSMGGWIAMQLSASFPEIVRRVVLEDSAGSESDLPGKVRAKTLIIWGENDNILPIRNGIALNSKIESSKLVKVDGVGHVCHWEDPDTFNELVERFLPT
jgi:pimeloyl-ACP methyl ester carboxylesterase